MFFSQDCMVTSGYNFEGYIIKEYKMYLTKPLLYATINEGYFSLSDDNMQKYCNRVDSELREQAFAIGANAIIGFSIDFKQISENYFGIVAKGTAVHIVKDEPPKFKVDCFSVKNYSTSCMIRPCEVFLLYNQSILVRMNLVKYTTDTIDAINVDIEFTTIFNQTFVAHDFSFIELSDSEDVLRTEFLEIALEKKQLRLIKSVTVKLNKYITSGRIIDVVDDTQLSALLPEVLREDKTEIGIDVVSKRIVLDNQWQCVCGKVNPNEIDKCSLCSRLLNPTSEYLDLNEPEFYKTLESQSDAKSVRDILPEYEIALGALFYAEMIQEVDKVVYSERMYGNSKNDALKLIRAVMAKRGDLIDLVDPAVVEVPCINETEFYDLLKSKSNANEIQSALADYKLALGEAFYTIMMKAMDKIVQGERLYGNSKGDAMRMIRKLMEERGE